MSTLTLRKLTVIPLISQSLFILITIILGFITPGYNHIRYTVSTLALSKYGYVQQLNFLQFGLSLLLSSLVFYKVSTYKPLKRLWVGIFVFSAVFMFIETLFPTDKIETADLLKNSLTVSGQIHLLALAVFFILAPVFTYVLSSLMKNDPVFAGFYKPTATGGYFLSFLCFVWSYCLITGTLFSFLGIFQKIILGLGFVWLISIHYTVYKMK